MNRKEKVEAKKAKIMDEILEKVLDKHDTEAIEQMNKDEQYKLIKNMLDEIANEIESRMSLNPREKMFYFKFAKEVFEQKTILVEKIADAIANQ